MKWMRVRTARCGRNDAWVSKGAFFRVGGCSWGAPPGGVVFGGIEQGAELEIKDGRKGG